jgi:hypothetical protein
MLAGILDGAISWQPDRGILAGDRAPEDQECCQIARALSNVD